MTKTASIVAAAAAACICTSMPAAAVDKNPFGLVYQGAITANKAGNVNIHPCLLYTSKEKPAVQRSG